MARGPGKHLRRLNAPSHWMLDKLGGVWAPKPRAGPHKAAECLPLVLILRNRLKYALTNREVSFIVKSRAVKVDGRIRTDSKFPAGFMDVITMEKTGDRIRLLYDVKGRFVLHPIPKEEVTTKVCRVRKVMYGPKRTPFLSTHDGRVIRFPDPNISAGDSVIIDTESGRIKDWIRFKPGCLVMITGGANTGRIGEVQTRERHPGSFDIVHVKDEADSKFATRMSNCFVIGSSKTAPLISLPKGNGIKLTLSQDRANRIENYARGRK